MEINVCIICYTRLDINAKQLFDGLAQQHYNKSCIVSVIKLQYWCIGKQILQLDTSSA